MKAAWFNALWVLGIVCLAAQAEPPRLRITSPPADAIVSGATRLAVAIEPNVGVQSVSFFVDGHLVCAVERPPFGCTWDPGDVVRGHHVRVVASLSDGGRLVDNVRTRDIGHVERVRTEAVLVPVIVTEHGRFVRGLKRQDFEVREDGVPQSIASFVSEDSPLDLVVAIDISGSMEHALPEVKSAVKQFLSKLRPGDSATLVGFNDTMFVVAEREKDPAAREKAIDLLTSWGGTALYDATARAIDMVTRESGRKGVVIFSDGDDRDSRMPREGAMARVQASDAMLFTVGFGAGATSPTLRASLDGYAQATGGRAFFPRHTGDLAGAFDAIVEDLSNQYVLSYSSSNQKQDGKWRNLDVRVRNGKYNVRARLGYRASAPQRAGR